MRWIKVGGTVGAAFLLLFAGASWLFHTTAGVHLLFGAITRFTPVEVAARDIRGSLASKVLFSGLKIRLPKTTISATRVTLSCAPSGLLLGRLDVTGLSGEDIEVESAEPRKNEPVSFIPPHVPRFVAAFEGRIRAFRIDNLRFIAREEPIVISQIKGRAAWHRGELSIQDLTAGSKAWDVSGRLDVGFYRPSLRSELWIGTKGERAGLNKLLIRANLKSAFARTRMTGVLSAWAYEGNESRVEVQAALAASEYTLDIRHLTLNRTENQGRIAGHGQIKTEKILPSFTGHVSIEQFRFQDLTPLNTALSGKADIEGTLEAYGGHFTISNTAKGGQAFKMDGTFQGDQRQVTAQIPSNRWLGGSLTGATTVNWEKNLRVTGHFNARGLNTGLIDETWQGVINADASFYLRGSGSGVSAAGLDARLLDSTFRQRPIKGLIDFTYENGFLRLTEMALKGRGFDVTAHGILAQRINYLANIQDLSSLIPGATGGFTGQGWLRYCKTDFAMDLSGIGKAFRYKGLSVGRMEISAAVDQGGAKSLSMEAVGQSIRYGGVDVGSLKAVIKGKISDHEGHVKAVGPGAWMRATLTGGYEKGVWKGSLKELSGSDKERGEWRLTKSSALTVSGKRIFVEPVILHGGREESVTASVNLQLKPIHGFVKAEWENLDLSRLDPIMLVSVNTRARGYIFLRWAKGVLDQLSGETDSRGGELGHKGLAVPLSRAQATLNWTSGGLKASGQVATAEGGKFRGEIYSALQPNLALPEDARFISNWEGFQTSVLTPFLPDTVELKSRVSGSLEGRLLPGRQVAGTVEAKLEKGTIGWRTEQGLVTAAVDHAGVRARWGSEGLKGDFDVQLGHQGYMRSFFSLPVPGRLPLRPLPAGPVDLRLDGRMEEQGLLSAFFPGLVQESKGSMTINAQVLGTWDQPRLAGSARLSNAAARLPAAGIQIQAVNARIELSENKINVEDFQAESGQGRIDGSGVVFLKDGRVEKFLGKLSGDRFQAIYLPDLRLLVSPSLSISGTGTRVALEGEIAVPQLLVYGPPTEDAVRSSPDVVVVGAKEKQKQKLPVDLQAKVRVVLGDDVRIKMQGIDARLEGAVALTVNGAEDIGGVGEVRIVKGQYRTYGVELKVERGRIVFAGPLERTRLDILAVRKIEGVARSIKLSDRFVRSTASGAAKSAVAQPSATTSASTETQTVGVQITGLAQKPRIALYSSPFLSDADTLSYMVLGRPVSGDAAQSSLLFSAAGSLFGRGEAGSIQEGVKKILGLETLEVGTETFTSQQGQVEQTMARVGRYLAPNLYIGIGRSLFTNEYVITARYSLSKSWEIQTRAGAQTGGEIYYKIEFD